MYQRWRWVGEKIQNNLIAAISQSGQNTSTFLKIVSEEELTV